MKLFLLPLFLLILSLTPFQTLSGASISLEERMTQTSSTSPIVREVNKTALVHLEKMLEVDPDFQTTYRRSLRKMLRNATASGDNALAQLFVFRLACLEAQTKSVHPAFFAELATHAPISPYLAAFWSDALLATNDNPHLVLALLNTYADETTPNRDIFRAKALMRLGRKLDALHAIINVFDPHCVQSLPDPVLFGLVGDICYANGLHREAAFSWQRAIRAHERYQNDSDLDIPIEDSCILFNYSIDTTRQKYRAIRTLLKAE